MPKFARPNSYTGKQSNQNWTGDSRAANSQEVAAGLSEQLYISPATLAAAIGTLLPHASETVAGIAEIATTAEVTTGTDDTRIVSPLKLAQRFASPPAIGSTAPAGGAFTTLTSTGATNIGSGAGVAAQVGNTTGTLGFYGSVGATRVTQAALTNSVTAGGVTGTIANFTDLSVYANDAATIRNDIYQLSLALANVVGALRSYGLLA